MALSKPIAQLDPGLLAGLEPIPLSLLADGDKATSDISLVGTIYSAGTYSYQFHLNPGIDYRFSTILEQGDALGDWAALIDAKGLVYWANELAQATLNIKLDSTIPVLLPQPDTLMLVMSNLLQGVANPFHMDIYADMHHYANNAVYRFNLVGNGTYFYTVNEAEKDFVLENYAESVRYEGVAFYGEDEAREGYVPVYRFVRNGSFFYTASEDEKNMLLQTHPEYGFDGVGFYVPAQETATTDPVYRLSNAETGNYLFTASPAEKLYALLQGGWQDEGVVFYALHQAEPEVVTVETAAVHEVTLLGLSGPTPDLLLA